MQKNQVKYISSLYDKKKRELEHRVVLDGLRLIYEAFKGKGNITRIYYTDDFINKTKSSNHIQELIKSDIPSEKIKNSEINKLSNNINPQGILAVCDLIPNKIINLALNKSNWVLLDNISDPGNLGTILRTAEWFGIKNIFISSNSADLYNDKVLRSAMGSHFYFNNIIQDHLIEGINILKDNGYEIIGTSTNGGQVTTANNEKKWALIMGNEANGISEDIIPMVDSFISIPQHGRVESLNVAIACGIILNGMIDN